ncbi:MAG: IclR family transcriptional regulator [Candidatus Fimivivens sp.]
MEQTKRGKIIQSVQRAIDILNCFDDAGTELSLSHISNRLALNKSTVHGILTTLCANGYMQQNTTGKYRVGHALIHKFRFAPEGYRAIFLEEAKPHMIRLANDYKMNISLFVLEDNALQLLNRTLPVNTAYTINPISNDHAEPLYCTASGRIRLAYMGTAERTQYFAQTQLDPLSIYTPTTRETVMAQIEEVREHGYSFENEELGEGISAISVPIVDNAGNLFGTFSMTGIAFHIARRKGELIADLKKTVKEITRTLF